MQRADTDKNSAEILMTIISDSYRIYAISKKNIPLRQFPDMTGPDGVCNPVRNVLRTAQLLRTGLQTPSGRMFSAPHNCCGRGCKPRLRTGLQTPSGRMFSAPHNCCGRGCKPRPADMSWEILFWKSLLDCT